MTTVVCVAHPDDFVLGAGGWLAEHSKSERVVIIIFSYGETAGLIKHPDIVRKEQRQYARDAAHHLGCKELVFLNTPDIKFIKSIADPMTARKVEELLRHYSPSKICTHMQDDIVTPNRAVSRLVVHIVKKLKLKADVYGFHTTSLLNWSQSIQPEVYVNITQAFPHKLVALRMFKYQQKYHPYLTVLTRFANRIWGIKAGFKYAELFYMLEK